MKPAALFSDNYFFENFSRMHIFAENYQKPKLDIMIASFHWIFLLFFVGKVNRFFVCVDVLSSEAIFRKCSYKRVFWKYAATLQENTHAEMWSNVKQLYWNHTSAWLFSCKRAAFKKKTFPTNTFGGCFRMFLWHIFPKIVHWPHVQCWVWCIPDFLRIFKCI